ncbi:gamma-glutamylcyclotransferase [Rhodocytophaga rosea]|uniref:Gamma-glutamylcyclotransferase n=1 Tax=Rhodocytophaga rosea TaxID=2704465 RepID=A0A6C0GR74_9BACT|nr:gamma-glutamylcyclotransferase family protein [Rhodocytophaga rosea]QHT70374.1 gamma-glutamylcyclotransferase [Rhodocytophaga rosea]
MTEEINEYLFSYGTLQYEQVQLDIFGRVLQGTADTLGGYTLSNIIIRDESFHTKAEQEYFPIATVSTNQADAIPGHVFTLTPLELLAADRYEPREYRRIKVVLQSEREAWVYVAASPIV